MKQIHNLYKLLILFCATFLAQNAVAQVKGDKYNYLNENQFTIKNVYSEDFDKLDCVHNGNFNDYSTATNANPSIVFEFESEVSIKRIILYNKNSSKRPTNAIVYGGTSKDNCNEEIVEQKLSFSSNMASIILNVSEKYQFIKIEFTNQLEECRIYEAVFYGGDATIPSVQHKPAKWYDLRKTLTINNAADDFDDDESLAMHAAYDGKTPIQSAHTLIDTIYVHRGTNVTLTLPDYLGDKTNNQSYQRWYNYMNEGTFKAENNSDGIVDYLTPGTAASGNPTNGTGYRFANGYIGQPLSSACLYVMNFYVPESDKNNFYLVACDVSGYTDYTKEFSVNSKTSTFGQDGTYWEPTLGHRFIYYLRVIDDETCSAYKKLNAGLPIEEKDISMPATRIPNKTEEMVALSMDARSYILPLDYNGEKDDAQNPLTVTIEGANDPKINSAGISLLNATNGTLSISGEDRVIFIKYPNTNTEDGTMSVNQTTDGKDPKATILVKRNDVLVAKFNLTFKEESRLLTQTQVSEANKDESSPYRYRMPDYLKENYELLTELNFDFDKSVASMYGQKQCYPFPLGWDSSTYGFYDGGTSGDAEGDFKANTSCPEWGYYGILNAYVECYDNGTKWAWNYPDIKVPDDDDPIRYNSNGVKSSYHLFADVSDRPGVLARLPFDHELCQGTELFVTAWVKSAGGNVDNDNAGVMFSIMGVTEPEEGSSTQVTTYTPIYRFQTGQIPVTYRNGGGVNIDGFSDGNNDWMQVYFSFINDKGQNFSKYVLQVDNNSASTKGGDIYIDDIRVYIATPNAKVTQLEAGCTNERTLLNISLNWDQLMSRLGHDETSTGEDGIDFCFIDKTKYYNYLNSHKDDYKGAIEASAVEIGNSSDPKNDSYTGTYNTFYFKMPFSDNSSYDTKNHPNLATPDQYGKAYFYGYTDNAGVKSLSVDFYSTLTPNRPYILLISTHNPNDETLDAEDFSANIDDACAINTEFYVTAQTLIRVNGEVVDPSTDFCSGQVFNFSTNLRVPTGVNEEDGTTIYKEIKDGVYFDWFFGTEEEFLASNSEYGNESLQSALTTFRDIFPKKENLDDVTAGEYPLPDNSTVTLTQNEIDIINAYLKDTGEADGIHNRLVLRKDKLDIMLLTSGLNLVVQPIQTLQSPDGSIDNELWAKICWNYIPLVLTTSGNAPQLHAGFNSVSYPADDFNPCLRIGLSQIKETTADKPLRVDLRGAQLVSKDAKSLGMVTSVSSEVFKNIYLVGTDDPEYNNEKFFPADFSEYSLPIGYLTELYAAPYISGSSYNDHMNIYFDTTTKQGNGFQFQPKEGYTYTFAVHFEEHGENGANVSNACFGVFTIDMKVVPENLVWSGVDATSNWNNDANWKRADKSALKKADGDSYLTNEANTTANGFVPMLFSNVIMPKGSKAELYMAGYANGGAWTNTSRPSYMELPTENIQYDLMAYDSNDALTTQRYRVNICRDIHFEPGSQMLHAEQLLYNKAWTDVEITPGQWTAVSTPLQDVVAGDWYAPKATGKQETEYFKDITFNTTDYNRLNPAVYQRSWSTGAKIVENDNGTTPVSFATEWSSAYNDASVPYVAGGGFSIQGILNQGQQPSSTDKLLFRFPKADTSYKVSTGTLSRTNAGRLLVSQMVDRSNPLQYNHPDVVSTTLTPSADGKYLMVGNPFMAPLDVQAFVAANSDVLAQKYWISSDLTTAAVTYDESNKTWSNTSLIAPYSVFYVEAKTPSTASVEVKFTADMQQFETTSTDAGSQAASLKITAEDTEGSSSAAVRYAASASNGFGMEDAQMISGLTGNADNAPQVYTVAGNTAVSVNQLKDAQRIPLGVSAADGSVVTLTFSGVAAVKDAALYDAELQSETPLHEGYQLTVNGSSYGRYFLIGKGSGTTTGISDVETGDNVSVSSILPRQIVVTSDAELRSVSVWSVSGALLKKATLNGDYTCTLNNVDSDVVVVHTETANGTQMTKLRVR